MPAPAILDAMTNANLRWGVHVPADASRARGRLLDAAEACFQRFGIANTTVEDVAREASVSRATVYRYFPGRDAIVSGVILRETERYLARIRPRVEAHADLGDAVLEFVEVTVRAARRDETVGMLFTSDDGLDASGILRETSVALFELVEGFLAPIFDARADQLQSGLATNDAAEWVLRSVLSLLTVSGPKRRTQAGLDRYLRAVLIPGLVRSCG